MEKKKSLVKLVESLSGVLFVIGYFKYDLIVATKLFIAASTFSILLSVILKVKIDKVQLITWIVALVLGGGSIWLNDESIIKWKPTLTNSILSIVLLLSHVIGKKTIAERLLDDKLNVKREKLRKLNLFAVGYLLFVAGLNVFVAQNFSTDIWVNFKFFGLLGINLVFFFLCFLYLKDELKEFSEKTKQ